MKTTVEISDALLARVKRHARHTGRPVRALIEEGLLLVLRQAECSEPYRLPDESVGKIGDTNPLEAMSWQDLRERIYTER